MKLTITRTGITPSQWKDAGDSSWRQWAYEAAMAQGPPKMAAPVTITVTPLCRDNRGRQEVGSQFLAVDKVLDGLVSAGVIGSRRDDWVVQVNYRRSVVAGEDGMMVVVEDDDQPFPPCTTRHRLSSV